MKKSKKCSCGKTVIPRNTLNYVEAYHVPVLTATECCQTGVIVRPILRLEYEEYTGPRTEDDWGFPINRRKK